MISTRFVVKPEGGQQCIFDYFSEEGEVSENLLREGGI